jgi:hypothetical protein
MPSPLRQSQNPAENMLASVSASPAVDPAMAAQLSAGDYGFDPAMVEQLAAQNGGAAPAVAPTFADDTLQVDPSLLESLPGQSGSAAPQSAGAPKVIRPPKGSASFDVRRLAVQTQEEYDALPPEMKDVLKMMRAGVQFTPTGIAEYVIQRREEARVGQTPQAQAALTRAQAQAQAAGAQAQTASIAAKQKQAEVQTFHDDLLYLDKLIDQVRDHPGLSDRVGGQWSTLNIGPALPAMRGTPGADFDVLLDQIKGKQFMQAYQTLRGGGPITDTEGEKATAALARLNKSQSEGSFKVALEEYRKIVREKAAWAREMGAKPPKMPRGTPSGAPERLPVASPTAGEMRMTVAEYKARTGKDITPRLYQSKTGKFIRIVP